MGLAQFDQALFEMLSTVFPNVRNAQEDRWSSDAIDSNAELRVPLITMWRLNNPVAFGEFSNDSMVRRGFRYSSDQYTGEEHGVYVRALPVRVQYQIDILSDKRHEVDDIFRELSMFLYMRGKIDVSFDAGVGRDPIVREFTLQILDNTNSTDYASFSDRGRLHRESLNIEIPNGQLIFTKDTPLVREIPVRILDMRGEELV